MTPELFTHLNGDYRERACTPPPEAHLRVKPLEWKQMNDDGTRWASEPTICGIFYACFNSEKGWFAFAKEWTGQYSPSLDAAKAAAQSEFERLIMSALATTEGSAE